MGDINTMKCIYFSENANYVASTNDPTLRPTNHICKNQHDCSYITDVNIDQFVTPSVTNNCDDKSLDMLIPTKQYEFEYEPYSDEYYEDSGYYELNGNSDIILIS